MRSPRLPFWLPLATVLLPLALALGWVMVGLGFNHTGAVIPEFSMVADTDHPLSLHEVLNLPRDRWSKDYPHRPLSSKAPASVWVKVSIFNPTDRPIHGILSDDYRFADHVVMWMPHGPNFDHVDSGSAIRAGAKALSGRDVAFNVNRPPGVEHPFFLHYTDTCGVFPHLEWWEEPSDFFTARTRGLLAEGAYFGVYLALLGYNLLLWQRLRFLGLGWYVLYLGGSGAFLLIAREFPQELGVPIRTIDVVMLLAAAAALAMLALTRFAREFLELSRVSPLTERIVQGLGFAQIIVFLGAAITPWLHQATAMGLALASLVVTHFVLLVAAFRSLRGGVSQARYFLLSFTCLFAGTAATVFMWMSHRVNDSVTLGAMLGSALEMLLLSLAVADRFAQVQQEAVQAQEKLAQEAEQRRLIEETYADELEIEVKERTRDLEQAMADKDRMLSVVGHDLRSPLIALMRTADISTGDFAREAARTGRTLLLLIEDLVLWARLRAGTRFLAVHPASNVLAPAVALHRAIALQGGMELIVEAGDDLQVETDLVLAQTLVRNLLANALKFAKARVVLRAVDEDGKVRFSVTNDGPPLSPEVAARIAADESGPLTASGGLGLRLCREICRALGLKLEAKSSAEAGTEFSFAVRAATAPLPLSP